MSTSSENIDNQTVYDDNSITLKQKVQMRLSRENTRQISIKRGSESGYEYAEAVAADFILSDRKMRLSELANQVTTLNEQFTQLKNEQKTISLEDLNTWNQVEKVRAEVRDMDSKYTQKNQDCLNSLDQQQKMIDAFTEKMENKFTLLDKEIEKMQYVMDRLMNTFDADREENTKRLLEVKSKLITKEFVEETAKAATEGCAETKNIVDLLKQLEEMYKTEIKEIKELHNYDVIQVSRDCTNRVDTLAADLVYKMNEIKSDAMANTTDLNDMKCTIENVTSDVRDLKLIFENDSVVIGYD